MAVEIRHHYKKGADGKPEGPILVDRVYRDGQPVGWMLREDYAAFTPVVKLTRDDAIEIVRECARLRAEEGVFLPGTKVGGGAPSAEQMAEALEKANQELDDEDDDDE